MTDPTWEFFHRLARRWHEWRLEKVTGTLRFDIRQDDRIDHWLLAIRQGDLSVSRDLVDADCVIHVDRSVFDRVVVGEAKPKSTWLRNDITVEGELVFFFLLEKLIPGPEAQHELRRAARDVTRQP